VVLNYFQTRPSGAFYVSDKLIETAARDSQQVKAGTMTKLKTLGQVGVLVVVTVLIGQHLS